jgi:hypothetical protein
MELRRSLGRSVIENVLNLVQTSWLSSNLELPSQIFLRIGLSSLTTSKVCDWGRVKNYHRCEVPSSSN